MPYLSTDGLDGWSDLPFFSSDLPAIDAALAQEAAAGADIWPRPDNVFRALRLTSPETARVVFLGQDPYPTPGHAHGLAFSTPADAKPLAASLRNVFTEMRDDLGAAPTSPDLTHWAEQGVLLLNTALTVRAGEPNAHAKLGWRALVEQVIGRVSTRPTAFVLWGKHAQSFRPYISTPANGEAHFILETPHPSPLSARRGFFGSKPFSQVNAWLESRGDSIAWV